MNGHNKTVFGNNNLKIKRGKRKEGNEI